MWTDERLNDLAGKMDAGFARVDADIRELRTLIFGLWGINMIAIVAAIVTVLATRG